MAKAQNTRVEIQTKKRCSVCGGNKLSQVLDLPKLPLTGIYLQHDIPGRFLPIDQGLSLCITCGHAQLLYSLDPKYLYDSTYTHRTSQSPIASGGNEFFANFLQSIVGDQQFDRIVDVGCNDQVLLKCLESRGRKLLGVDPIWRGNEPAPNGKIRVIGKYIEEVDLERELEGKPDLVVSTHTFEHIDQPRSQLQRLVDAAAEDAIFVIEVPGFDALLETQRFDQIFHQHIQYFSLASFSRMVNELGCKVVGYTFNYAFWGGTMLVAFRRQSAGDREVVKHLVPTEELVIARYRMFQAQIAALSQTMATLAGTSLFGFGAAQMLPILAYHMGTDLCELKCIWDDDTRRENLYYPHLKPVIRRPSEDLSLEGANVLLTALDSARPILKRLISLKPKRILVPLQNF